MSRWKTTFPIAFAGCLSGVFSLVTAVIYTSSGIAFLLAVTAAAAVISWVLGIIALVAGAQRPERKKGLGPAVTGACLAIGASFLAIGIG